MIYKVPITSRTPSILFDTDDGVLTIQGRCICEYPQDFFKDLFSTINVYRKSPNSETTINIQIDYANTSSTKSILDIMKKFENLKSMTVINWMYEKDDEDILELGQDFQCIIKLDFIFKEI